MLCIQRDFFTNISVFVVTTNQINKAEVDNKLAEKM
jgi:hypothetical protein